MKEENRKTKMGFITGGPTEAIVVSGCFHSKPLIVVRFDNNYEIYFSNIEIGISGANQWSFLL